MYLDSYDLDTPEGFEAFMRDMDANSDRRLMAARKRQIEAGIIREDGSLVSDELPADMQPGAKTTCDDL